MAESKPSKSERKREHRALQALGERLIDLDDMYLDQLELPERLLEAIRDVRRMKSREAARRQKQFIGKLMSDIDPQPVQALLDSLHADDRRQKRVFANAERWRDRLIRGGRGALKAFEAEIGNEPEELADLLSELARAKSDREEATVKRRIFRCVHRTLVAHSTDR